MGQFGCGCTNRRSDRSKRPDSQSPYQGTQPTNSTPSHNPIHIHIHVHVPIPIPIPPSHSYLVCRTDTSSRLSACVSRGSGETNSDWGGVGGWHYDQTTASCYQQDTTNEIPRLRQLGQMGQMGQLGQAGHKWTSRIRFNQIVKKSDNPTIPRLHPSSP